MSQFNSNTEIVFFDTEIDSVHKKILDLGAIRAFVPVRNAEGRRFHLNNLIEFGRFIKNSFFLCGHNIIQFDLRYIFPVIENAGIHSVIDTLYLSALLFPKKPYHSLLKDDKLQTEDLNNPLNDAQKSMELLMDEAAAFENLDSDLKKIYYTILGMQSEFRGFFRYLGFHEKTDRLVETIRRRFYGKICENADIAGLAGNYPIEFAYCLAVIDTGDRESIIPYWVLKNFPHVQNIYHMLCGNPCKEGCSYCRNIFDIHAHLRKKFGYESFRTYNGEPLQEKAVAAAVSGKSLLAVFPTGGGKSITFQLPALIAADATHSLTVVISPLQSLMKDQVDNLAKLGITDAVTINGLLNAVERTEALERVENGIASILYISPESLRSKTIERLLYGRNIARFVIDEAHCFSSWGQDFRVDYLYIGDFIAKLQEKKNTKIPVSCFTATAKQKVISDIREYFSQKLGIGLELYTTNAARANLRYEVIYLENDVEKYNKLRILLEQKNCPSIVYVSRTKKAEEIAEKLSKDGFNARPFHGKMDNDIKIANQESFIEGETQIIVATSAFGMGVDKKDVKLVVHFDISDSLENYIQEAGRAGRDEHIYAECFVLFNENDLDKHFILLNQTKLSISEIQQVWKAVKDLTGNRKRICCSALEIARAAGWDTSLDVETKVRTAVSALETAGYIRRGQNCPRVYADSICVKNAAEAAAKIDKSAKFSEKQKENAKRIIIKLIATRSRSYADANDAESRVDYIADHLGLEKQDVIELVDIMREEKILANGKEMSVYIDLSEQKGHGKSAALNKFLTLERFLLEQLQQEGVRINYKAVNEEAQQRGIKFSTVNRLRTILYFWIIKGCIKKPEGEISSSMLVLPETEIEQFQKRFEQRAVLVEFIERYFLQKAQEKKESAEGGNILIPFSVQELKEAYAEEITWMHSNEISLKEVEDALLYMSKTGAYRIEGGFLVLYNAMEIVRLEMDNKKRYKAEDYKQLKEFYDSKTQQIHIVGEYANMMVYNYEAALTFVNDYFQMDYKMFLTKYFRGSRRGEIERNITPMKYRKLFEDLSPRQTEIINDDSSREIVVAAGPGSGKTMILVHKLASLMLLEDVKHEQLLMLTFSRAAAMEFKSRLVNLIGNAAYFVEIKTFHSYCFDLLGKIGNLEGSKNVVYDAVQIIKNKEVELERITKTVLVIDEAQDMDENEFQLVQSLMECNEEMRVIAVGDDDQNIYQFRGSDSKYMASLLGMDSAKKYELVENYRSARKIVDFSDYYVQTIPNRLKSQKIQAVAVKAGEVFLTRVRHSLEMAVTMQVFQNRNQIREKKAAVLTTTNQQAYLIAEALKHFGIDARLIQANDDFAVGNLVEMRYFLSVLKQKKEPVISEEHWELALQKLKERYPRSTNVKPCCYILNCFAESNKKLYYTDLYEFLMEIHFGDLEKDCKNVVTVSTIHKAKGREYDWVYLLLSSQSDYSKRQIYVGLTRAKECLYIYHNTGYFNEILKDIEQLNVYESMDDTVYPKPDEVAFPLSYRDVHLGYFKNDYRENLIQKIQAGDPLEIVEETYDNKTIFYFAVAEQGNKQKIARCSADFCTKVLRQKAEGYLPCRAKVSAVAKWRDKETNQEYDIVLPVLWMKAAQPKRH